MFSTKVGRSKGRRRSNRGEEAERGGRGRKIWEVLRLVTEKAKEALLVMGGEGKNQWRNYTNVNTGLITYFFFNCYCDFF